MQLFFDPNANHDSFSLNPTESKHCVQVLRKTKGDVITVIDGKGKFYECQIIGLFKNNCLLKVNNVLIEQYVKAKNIHIAIAPTKNISRIEWFVEKAVEIGINEITFINSQYSVRNDVNIDRITKKAISSIKQSQRATLPKINCTIKFSDFVKSENLNTIKDKLIAHQSTKSGKNLLDYLDKENIIVMIGPEGGFSQSEVEFAELNNFKILDLGNNILRTETAGLLCCAILNQ